MRMRRFIGPIAIIQSILFLEHYLLYKTWTFSVAEHASGALWIKPILGLLSVSFIAASLLAWRYTNPALRAFYWVSGFGWECRISFFRRCSCPGSSTEWREWLACK